MTTDLAFVTRLTDITPPNTDTPDCHNRVFASTVGATPTGWKELEMLRVTFYWGHDDLDDYTEDDLPVQVELPALPPVGTLVNFRSPMDNRKITAVVLPDAFELHITSDGSLYEIGVEPAY